MTGPREAAPRSRGAVAVTLCFVALFGALPVEAQITNDNHDYVAGLYIAVFARSADVNGYLYWSSTLDNNQYPLPGYSADTVDQVTNAFLANQEYTNVYNSLVSNGGVSIAQGLDCSHTPNPTFPGSDSNAVL